MTRPRRASAQTLLVLQAFMAHRRRWRHGYDLSSETGLPSGTIYPVLMRLSERQLLDAEWEPSPTPGRPPRRMYRLTADGVAVAKAELAAEEAEAGDFVSVPARGRA
jgi:DNA-binding PadR family transcriptional regulator